MKLFLVLLATAYVSGAAIGNERSYEHGNERGKELSYEHIGYEPIGYERGNERGKERGNERGYNPIGNVRGYERGYESIGFEPIGYEPIGYKRGYEPISYDQPDFDRYSYGYGNPSEPKESGLITVPVPYVIGRQGIGFDRRTAFAYGFRMPLTLELLEVLRRYPEYPMKVVKA